MKNKVVIVGTGNVGLSYAYALINQSTPVQELVLIDIDKERAIGEALDLSHGTSYGQNHIKVKAGDYSDCADADIVCISAGANQENGETRLDLVAKNKIVFESVVEQVVASGFDGIFLIATNPVDIMTHYTWQVSGFARHKVIGSGTTLDTARLRYELSNASDISPHNVHAYIIGEHGDSEFVPWECASIGTQPITDYLNPEQMTDIENRVKNAAYEIISKKGNTSYGIGMCLVKITNAILNNENTVLSVSTYDEANDVFIGLPAIINRSGIKRKLRLTLSKESEQRLQKSIDIIKSYL